MGLYNFILISGREKERRKPANDCGPAEEEKKKKKSGLLLLPLTYREKKEKGRKRPFPFSCHARKRKGEQLRRCAGRGEGEKRNHLTIPRPHY